MKNLLSLLGGAAIGAAAVYFGFVFPAPTKTSLEIGPVKYSCELSGGTFKNGSCACPLEGEQTQTEMYDKKTGFCQSSVGGAGGDAFWAESGLPWGSYKYYHDIVNHWCEQSGGSKSGAACICSSGKTYDKSIGQCK